MLSQACHALVQTVGCPSHVWPPLTCSGGGLVAEVGVGSATEEMVDWGSTTMWKLLIAAMETYVCMTLCGHNYVNSVGRKYIVHTLFTTVHAASGLRTTKPIRSPITELLDLQIMVIIRKYIVATCTHKECSTHMYMYNSSRLSCVDKCD